MDLSETAIAKASERNGTQANVTLKVADFFEVEGSYDYIFDYTFSCAIDPSLRSLWASTLHKLLKTDGHALILMFPLDEREGGPPFSWTEEDYKEMLGDLFELVWIRDEVDSAPKRKGLEKLSLWRRK
jgi:methyl halide transferase